MATQLILTHSVNDDRASLPFGKFHYSPDNLVLDLVDLNYVMIQDNAFALTEAGVDYVKHRGLDTVNRLLHNFSLQVAEEHSGRYTLQSTQSGNISIVPNRGQQYREAKRSHIQPPME